MGANLINNKAVSLVLVGYRSYTAALLSQDVEAEVFRVILASNAIWGGFKAGICTKHLRESILGLVDDACTFGGL
jgi:hypothetical protein